MTGSDIAVRVLKKHGVSTVFGLPGAAVLSLYNSLANDGSIRHILCTHEQYCAFAADGYSRASALPGVVIATSGPGATNLVTALANAYMDSVPLVAITGNVPSSSLGKDSFQEIDIAGVTMPITKHNMIVKSVSLLESALCDAFTVACSGRKGPVLVDVTSDCFDGETEYLDLPVRKIDNPQFDITQSLALIESAKRPVICAGGGAVSADASNELKRLADLLYCPVALTNMGIGAFPADDPKYIGRVGMQATDALGKAFADTDLLIACGVRFSDRFTSSLSLSNGLHVLHIDIDLAEISKVIKAYSYIHGDVKDVLFELNKHIKQRPHRDFPSFKATQNNALPQRIFDYYNKNHDSTVFTTDVGLHQLWAVNALRVNSPRTFLTSGGLGSMGYGLPAAIGACAAKDGAKAVVFSGDGSFLMTSNELITAHREKCDLTVVVFNNSSLGMVRYWQKQRFGDRFYMTSLDEEPDFELIAKSCKAKYFRIKDGDDVEKVLAQTGNGVCVVECTTDKDLYL